MELFRDNTAHEYIRSLFCKTLKINRLSMSINTDYAQLQQLQELNEQNRPWLFPKNPDYKSEEEKEASQLSQSDEMLNVEIVDVKCEPEIDSTDK